jgi:transcription initiation factor TFIID TATA-box-binding protein
LFFDKGITFEYFWFFLNVLTLFLFLDMKICNITSTAKISKKPLNLVYISQNLWNSIYNPKRFNAIIYRIRSPKITSLIFKTGKIVIIGAQTTEDAKTGARKTARAIQKILIKQKTLIFCQKFTIQNIVAMKPCLLSPIL